MTTGPRRADFEMVSAGPAPDPRSHIADPETRP